MEQRCGLDVLLSEKDFKMDRIPGGDKLCSQVKQEKPQLRMRKSKKRKKYGNAIIYSTETGWLNSRIEKLEKYS